MSNLDLYLPQLCYLVITKQNKECIFHLKKFIVEISIQNSNIGLRALHYFQSWSEDDINTIVYVQAAIDFYDLLEQALVNQTLPKQFRTEEPQVLEMSEYLDKQFKEKYIGFQRDYLNELKQLSLGLKDPIVK